MIELNSKKTISINIISSVLQVLFVGVVYLVLYKYLLKTLGVELLGVWSIILATSSIANLANFGITSGLVKFVADYNARNLNSSIPQLIFTSFISISVFFAVIIAIFYFFAKFLLGYIVDLEYLDVAIEILPYSLICLFINSLGGVFTSTLEGFQKNYIRNYLLIFSSFFLLVSSYFLVPVFQLKGVAIAQILQATIVLTGSFVYLSYTFQFAIFNKWNWDKTIFKELLNFGLKFQVISIFQMLYEPITKGLISKFGGLALLGYYEMAARLVNQIRALIVNANQVMVPVVAHTTNTNKKGLGKLYQKTMTVTFFINVILITGLLVFTPLISVLWIGFLESSFIFSMIILSLAMFVNIMAGPAYFSSIGEGKLNLILLSQSIIGILNLVLGIVLGSLYSGKGVVVSWGIALGIGSIYLVYKFQKQRKISFWFIFSKYNTYLIFVSMIFVIFNLYFFEILLSYLGSIWLVLVSSMVFLLSITGMFLLKNDEFKEFRKIFKKSGSNPSV